MVAGDLYDLAIEKPQYTDTESDRMDISHGQRLDWTFIRVLNRPRTSPPPANYLNLAALCFATPRWTFPRAA